MDHLGCFLNCGSWNKSELQIHIHASSLAWKDLKILVSTKDKYAATELNPVLMITTWTSAFLQYCPDMS